MVQRRGTDGVLPRVSVLLRQLPRPESATDLEGPLDPDHADHALGEAIAALRDRVADPPGHAALLAELYQLRWELRVQVAADRDRRLEVLATGMRELRRLREPAGLVHRLTDAILTYGGFDRVLVSRVEGSVWKPWRSLSRRSVADEEEAFVQWLLHGPALRLDRSIHESQVITRRSPLLVSPERDAARMSPSFLRVRPQRLRSYAVAPLTLLDDVIGLVHVDYVDREVDSVDLEILAELTRGFDHLHERAVLLERLHRQRTQVSAALASVSEAIESTADLGLGSSQPPSDIPSGAPRPGRGQPPDELARLLTARELEVLRLLSTGATNDRIAEILVISTDTVKSHVKNILRKLAVDNRSEAIVHYLRLSMGGE